MDELLRNPIPSIQLAKHAGELRYTYHALQRSIERGITTDQIEAALNAAMVEVIENYLGGPSPSCLLLVWNQDAHPLHVIVAYGFMEVVTVYVPAPPRWVTPRTRGGRL